MLRLAATLLLSAALLVAASFKLYLTDGTYQLVREYKVEGDRVRFYAVERSEWEEVPLSLVDIKRTESERQARETELRKEAQEIAAEDKYEREQRDLISRIPVEAGVYMVEGQQIRALKQSESSAVNSKRRSILKVLVPIPVVTGKTTVELDGEHSATVLDNPRPEFYFRLSREERFGIVRLTPKKDARIVQTWTIIPVTKQIAEEEDDVQIFRQQLADGLYRIWPMAPLKPGEYAVVEFTEGEGNIQTWDFAIKGK
jgi:hypothetical protein